MEKNRKKSVCMYIYNIYTYITESLFCTPETQHYKPTLYQVKKRSHTITLYIPEWLRL